MSHSPDQIRELFLQAVEIGSPQERHSFLQKACGDNDHVRQRVNALIVAHERPESLLDKEALAHLGLTLDTAAMLHGKASQAPERIGPYQLIEQIGEGGFGIVYLAEQLEPLRRHVALKIIKPGMDSREVIARFEVERQALALMDHPGIARVLEAGTTDSGRPYFVMELVRGIPITEYCDQCHLTTRERLGLFIEVCQAVQHAHQKGIIHRDLKPTNVLVALQDGKPAVKVIDFGVAKAISLRLTDRTLMTRISQLIGTPLYMSPEQTEMGPLDIDTRSDIYSLGVMLYELLTGATPFEHARLKEAGYDELRRIIREEEPLKPSSRLSTLNAGAISTVVERRRTDVRKLRQALRGDLDWVVMKALDKDRTRRYGTANALSRDLERFLAEEPVEAGRPSTSYRLHKYLRRHRVFLTTASIVSALLLTATVVSGWEAVRATRAERVAQDHLEAERKARRAEIKARGAAEEANRVAKRQEQLARQQRDLTLENLYVAQIRLAHQDWKSGHLSRMISTLDTLVPRDGLPDFRGWEWYYLARLAHARLNGFDPQVGPINNVNWSPDGRLVAVTGTRGAKIFEPVSQQVVRYFPGHTHALWSPDGACLATQQKDQQRPKICVWDAEDWRILGKAPSGGLLRAIAWRPDSGALGWGIADGRFSYWEVDDASPAPLRYPTKQVFGIRTAAWSPDGRDLILGGTFPRTIVYWDTVEDELAKTFAPLPDAPTHIALSPDGERYATASIKGDLTIRRLRNDDVVREFGAHNGQAFSCVWSADGMRLASAGEDNLVRVWNTDTGQQVDKFAGHRDIATSVDWSPINDRIASGSRDGTVRFWRSGESQEALLLPGRCAAAWSPDGSRIVSNDPRRGDNATYSILDSNTGHVIEPLRVGAAGSMSVFAWSPNGKLIAGAGFHGEAAVWDADTGQSLHWLEHAHIPKNGGWGETRCVAWSPDSRQFATCGQDGLVKLWETSTGKLLREFDDHHARLGSLCWSPDGRWLASADWNRNIRIRTANGRQTAWEINQTPSSVGPGAGGNATIAWSPDSQRLAAVDSSSEIVVYRLQDGKKFEVLWRVDAHTSVIRCIAWSPDGNRIASGSEDRTVKVWNAKTGRELLTLRGHLGIVMSVAWSPDSRRLASSTDNALDRPSLFIWDASGGSDALANLPLSHPGVGRSADD